MGKPRESRKNKGSALSLPRTLVLLGSGELGREVAISAKRLGCRVTAVDSYAGAPAMQVADAFEVINMLDGDALERVVRKHLGDGSGGLVVPEIEAIRTEALVKLEGVGFSVAPSARAAHLTMNRDAIREVAAKKLGLRTARYGYAASAEELREQVMGLGGKKGIGLACVVKPVMSSSGKGQSVVRKPSEIAGAWEHACAGMRGDTQRVIVEEFIDFDYEITLLTVRQRREVAGRRLSEKERTIFVKPIGHRQERGDYQESWLPCEMEPGLLRQAQRMARAVTAEIAGENGAGLFGVEFFVRKGRKEKKGEVIFSELSPRPHDTGMVTMISQELSEFDLHVRAMLGLPIVEIGYAGGTSASAVVLGREESSDEPRYEGVDRALGMGNVQMRIFSKPTTRKYRRMGVVLARVEKEGKAGVKAARALAEKAARSVKVVRGS